MHTAFSLSLSLAFMVAVYKYLKQKKCYLSQPPKGFSPKQLLKPDVLEALNKQWAHK